MPLADLPISSRPRLRDGTVRVAVEVAPEGRLEAVCLMVGLGGMALALSLVVAQRTFSPVVRTEAALRTAMAAADFDRAVCPDGWAATHARLLGRTESEVAGWYLREALTLSDEEVITVVGTYVTRPQDFRQIEGEALTRNQIVLCIAESRRLTTPLDQLIPPGLRTGPPDAGPPGT